MSSRHGSYDRWLEKHAPPTVYLYSAFIIVLMPAFHFVLGAVPGHPADSLTQRLIAAGWSAFVALAVYFIRPLRRFADVAQFANVLPTMLIIDVLVVDSRNHYLYIASGLLMIVGAQQAFYRPLYLGGAMLIAFAFQALYSALSGQFYEPANLAALAIYGTGYVLAFMPATYRMAIQRRELLGRISAQRLAEKVEARERALRESQERLAEVHAMTHLGNWSRDVRSGNVECSTELLRMLGVAQTTPAHLLRDVYERFVHRDDRQDVAAAMRRAEVSGVPFDVDHRLVRDDATMWVHLHGKFEYDEDGRPQRLFAAVLDITRRKEAEESLKFVASTDSLTGLPNRVTLQRRLQDAIRAADVRGRQGAVYFLDLDHFKDINDTLGHSVGDVLLRAVAARISSALPPKSFISRWGGDEFVVVVTELSVSPTHVARELAALFDQPFAIDGYEFVISSSIGISVFPDDSMDSTILIRNADTAMYRAKEHREHGFCMFEPAMHDEARVRHRLQNELRKGLANDSFVLHYQPIVAAADGSIVGAEALLRLYAADGELLLPSSFIGVAEETGLIVAIGAWVLRQACMEIAECAANETPVRISVNISARHFMHPSFPETVEAMLKEYRVSGSLLDIEITETVLMSDVGTVLAVLDKLRALGVCVTVDDFGTGYSSLAYLRQFPLNALKLDRTFISDVTDPQQRMIARSIIRIAHTLGMSVTAEGVEDVAQYDVLDGLRCDRIQGFYNARPMPSANFRALLEEHRDKPLVERETRSSARIVRLRAQGA